MKLVDRFRLYEKFLVGDGCWEWQAGCSSDGYGMFRLGGRGFNAHRVVYELLCGPVPADHDLHHDECRNRKCVRPDHLKVLPHDEHTRLHRSLRTHCKRGHELTEENTYCRPGNTRIRQCRICIRIRGRELDARRLKARRGEEE